jgi:DNA-binding NarL/FixJ family response regulator
MSPAGRRKHKQRSAQSARHADARTGAEPAAAGLRTARFQLAGDDYIVLSYPHAAVAAPAALTSTERAIFSALLSGQSNPQIAASRGRALRTIANQVAAIFHKLGVSSRAELVAKFSARP